ncbi:hypothetical protein TSAR_012510 [Trichomalopsis sarcophagae]|uniref:STAS domain-containing protein n=1 Tax=Trichomalopsis sarcophagae TaxID=543379 RepID=A0A232EUL3_9HYME|nr:hypothetical protein TSAR_012510 [Trichomalopsis sarcophagae]
MASDNDTTQDLRRFQAKESQAILKLDVERPVLEQQDLHQLYQYEKPKKSVIQNIKKSIGSSSCKGCVQNVIPASYWLRKYKWQTDFIHDVISGLTVAIMHIPQGMAYALLGNLTPVVGIYMAFFPVLIYVFLGTSRHVSMGTFAVVCLMTGRAVTSYATPLETISSANNTLEGSQLLLHNTEIYTPIQVATAVTFMVGIIELIMYTFRLGVISTLLSEPFVNGFTTGAAVQVLLSQLFDLIGLSSTKPKGYFKFIKTIIVIFHDIPYANTAAVIISLIASCIMILNNELLKPWIGKKCSFPIPIELIAVIAGTLVSRYFDLPTLYNIKTVGNIPIGIPEPQLPAFKLLPTVALESIGITMVSYTVTMSMSLIFAKKLHYEIDSNQELFAMGSSNIFGSFFSCMPVSASLSRSLIQQAVGGRTQLASIVSCLILLVILLWIGPFFEPLPRCILASIIVVALKGMLVQAKELAKFWKLSKIDGIVWFITFFTTVLINIDVGLVSGLLASIVSVLFQSVRPYSCLLGHVPNTELYLDTSRYIGVAEIFGVKIFHYSGNLNFMNANRLSPDLQDKVGVRPRQVLKYRHKLAKKGIYAEANDFENKCTLRCIVVDMSAVSKIDSSGVVTLREVVADFAQIDIPVYLAACSALVYDKIQKCDMFEKGELSFMIFATVHDAVFFAQRELVSKSS